MHQLDKAVHTTYSNGRKEYKPDQSQVYSGISSADLRFYMEVSNRQLSDLQYEAVTSSSLKKFHTQ